MDPDQNQRNTRNQLNSRGSGSVPGSDFPPENPDRNTPESDSRNAQTTDRQPRYSDGFTMIPPNESRRSSLKKIAQKGEEDLQRWKETHRPAAVHVPPEKLGGAITMAEAREKQFIGARFSKLQKKLEKEDMDKRRRQEKEEEYQKMKAKQREKAERLEKRERQEEQTRRDQFRQDHLRVTENFLQRLERRAPHPQTSTDASSTSEPLEGKQNAKKSEREIQLDHKSVNAAFLDRIEGRSRQHEEKTKRDGVREAERPCLASDTFGNQSVQTSHQQQPLTYLKSDSGQSCSGWAAEADPEPDCEWNLMKLMSSFPNYDRCFLEDILTQCNGDYQQAYELLICTLS
ncbi:epithelial-stromal interaction protein 1 isoform X2 [Sphaeramia orbicularis]|uniref:epithelial-stromal interaction protein 1 isoform X2 n=1 Tax=Sphaeramia orbicularis TaxID=375764 RepID=UPI00117E467A|nr:epithelial-stromal interaction protein 1 isoform X2 [Sphaeramia orbicularis]